MYLLMRYYRNLGHESFKINIYASDLYRNIYYSVQIQTNMNLDTRLFLKHFCINWNAVPVTATLTASCCHPIIDAVEQSDSASEHDIDSCTLNPAVQELKGQQYKSNGNHKRRIHTHADTKRWQRVTFLALSASWWGRGKRGRWEQKREEEVFND